MSLLGGSFIPFMIFTLLVVTRIRRHVRPKLTETRCCKVMSLLRGQFYPIYYLHPFSLLVVVTQIRGHIRPMLMETRRCKVTSLLRGEFHPIYYLHPSFSLLAVAQMRGHIDSRFFSPFPTTFRAFAFLSREDASPFFPSSTHVERVRPSAVGNTSTVSTYTWCIFSVTLGVPRNVDFPLICSLSGFLQSPQREESQHRTSCA